MSQVPINAAAGTRYRILPPVLWLLAAGYVLLLHPGHEVFMLPTADDPSELEEFTIPIDWRPYLSVAAIAVVAGLFHGLVVRVPVWVSHVHLILFAGASFGLLNTEAFYDALIGFGPFSPSDLGVEDAESLRIAVAQTSRNFGWVVVGSLVISGMGLTILAITEARRRLRKPR